MYVPLYYCGNVHMKIKMTNGFSYIDIFLQHWKHKLEIKITMQLSLLQEVVPNMEQTVNHYYVHFKVLRPSIG